MSLPLSLTDHLHPQGKKSFGNQHELQIEIPCTLKYHIICRRHEIFHYHPGLLSFPRLQHLQPELFTQSPICCLKSINESLHRENHFHLYVGPFNINKEWLFVVSNERPLPRHSCKGSNWFSILIDQALHIVQVFDSCVGPLDNKRSDWNPCQMTDSYLFTLILEQSAHKN